MNISSISFRIVQQVVRMFVVVVTIFAGEFSFPFISFFFRKKIFDIIVSLIVTILTLEFDNLTCRRGNFTSRFSRLSSFRAIHNHSSPFKHNQLGTIDVHIEQQKINFEKNCLEIKYQVGVHNKSN